MTSIISKEWELIDPCPDIHALFIEFNYKYFWGKLEGVEVKWSPRMTLCAGVCSYEGRGGLCSVRLSAPLLKLRPRKDLVETLLHEMIHAFLFVTANNRDRDGHGPEFQKHMHRINNESGCNITIYHSFHEEVRLYQQHVWRCDGPCKGRKPYYGVVRRSTNRAPSARDFWWPEHQKTCGGIYHKVQEPEEFTKKKQKEAEKKEKNNNKKGTNSGDIRKYVNTTGATGVQSGAPKGPKSTSPNIAAGRGSLSGPAASTSGSGKVTRPVSGAGISTSSNISGFGELNGAKKGFGGTATANRGGKTLVVTGRKDKREDEASTSAETPSSFRPFEGRGFVMGSSSSSSGNVLQDRQKFLDRFNSPARGNPEKKQKTEIKETPCPICSKPVTLEELNPHLDECLGNMSMEDYEPTQDNPTTSKEVIVLSDDEDESNLEQCPLCSAYYLKDALQSHIDNCVQHLHDSFVDYGDEEVMIETQVKVEKKEDEVKCPACGATVEKSLINEHLDGCLM